MQWKIQREEGFSKYLRRLGSKEQDNFFQTVKDLEMAADPRRLGIPKQTKKHGICYVANVTGSYRLAYKVFVKEGIVQLVILGDHKTVYGKD
jgi:mRNA-degrading endonuclease RelE of RelBE toxin-antitoxin system